MDRRFSEIELMFISDQLYVHGDYLTDLVIDAIESKGLITQQEKDHLIDSISYEVIDRKGINPMLIMNFPDYGRFIEINYHKRSRNSATLDSINANAAVWGRPNRKKMKRTKKDTRWYSKNVYGSLNRLIGILMYELSDEERTRLTRILENKQAS